MSKSNNINRRTFLKTSGLFLGAAAVPGLVRQPVSAAPAIITLDGNRPQLNQGIQIGDVSSGQAVIWSRADRPSRLQVEYSLHENFRNPVMIRGPFALESSDYTAHLDLKRLPPNHEIFIRAQFQDLSNERILSEAVSGSFRTAPEFHRHHRTRPIRFVWSGDTAGQGWGINPDFGGMRIYETMRQTHPDFFIHSGDNIYADGPIEEFVTAEGSKPWRNIVTEEVSKVAESIGEFRGRYKYNLMDDNVRRFNAEVPQIWQWDDHEVVNNWSDGKDLSDDDRYTEKNVPLLVARGTQAFLEYAPSKQVDNRDSERIYRKVSYGKMLDVFVLDMRSYRAANSYNRQTEPGEDTAFLGRQQLRWLKNALKNSRATWKVIASDMPLGLQVGDGTDAEGRLRFENAANGDGPVLGREFEIAEVLRFIKRRDIDNVVWFTADVHYCAAHFYNPDKAVFQDYKPFWEFVTGPLNAGSFGPNELDNTFGPEVVYQKAPPAANYSPLAGLQFFGQVDIEPYSETMTVQLKDIDGNTLFTQDIEPERGHRRDRHHHHHEDDK